MALSKRETLVETALSLFMREGFHAVGIDRIIAEAGVAKMTLYNHFKTKDDLILAALRLRDEQFRLWFDRKVEKRGGTPAERLLAAFDVVAEWIGSPQFQGCTFINASAEYGDSNSAIHRAAAEHKRLVLDGFRGRVRQAGLSNSDSLAMQLNLLMEGAIVTAHTADRPDAVGEAKAAAATLIEAAGIAA